MKKLFEILFLVLLLSSAITLYSQENDSLYDVNYDRYIANEIFNKRIVMIGEGINHQNPITAYNLINTLNAWADRLKEDEHLNSNLVLIVEYDSATTNRINNYVFTGDIRPLLDYVAPSIELELLELYYELRKIQIRINEINYNRKNKINFEVKGFEEIGYNVKEDYFRKNQKENELWFINERDVYTSKGIIRYLKEKPEKNALLYYGSAHLQLGYVNKRLGGFSIPDEESMGYWLAQYLVNEFGIENVDLIASIGLRSWAFNNSPFKHLEEKAFLLKNRHDIIKNWCLNGVNKYIVNPYIEIPLHTINYSLSRYIVEKSIERASKFEKLLPGHKAYTGLMSLQYISIITGNNFKNPDSLKRWYSKNEFKGFIMLDSKEFYDNMFLYYLKYASGGNGKYVLTQLGFPDNIRQYESTSEIMWKERMWKQALPDIKIINAIGIYWAGYTDEKVEAKEYLKSATGKDFEEPAEYLKWWRREYRKYGI